MDTKKLMVLQMIFYVIIFILTNAAAEVKKETTSKGLFAISIQLTLMMNWILLRMSMGD